MFINVNMGEKWGLQIKPSWYISLKHWVLEN